MSIPFTNNITAIDGVSATTTSSGYDISKRQQITVQFVASGITTGNGVFSIDVSNDGTNWITGAAFLDPTATASTTLVTSKTLSANGTAGAILKPGFRLMRVKVVFTSDGAYSAIIQNG